MFIYIYTYKHIVCVCVCIKVLYVHTHRHVHICKKQVRFYTGQKNYTGQDRKVTEVLKVSNTVIQQE